MIRLMPALVLLAVLLLAGCAATGAKSHSSAYAVTALRGQSQTEREADQAACEAETESVIRDNQPLRVSILVLGVLFGPIGQLVGEGTGLIAGTPVDYRGCMERRGYELQNIYWPGA